MKEFENKIKLLRKELRSYSDSKKKKTSKNFFKTGKGEYGYGDVFLGVTVPICRKIAIKYKNLSMKNITHLINSKIHEERLVGILILVHVYEINPESIKKKIVKYYLDNSNKINNWDLVDLSAPKIIGNFLKYKNNRNILEKLAKSDNLWKKRISIISTYSFIKNNDFDDCFKISNILMNDKHDLIHKAVGWMLREVGNRNMSKEESFLKKNYKIMPRTMLRYAIEKFPKNKRMIYMRK